MAPTITEVAPEMHAALAAQLRVLGFEFPTARADASQFASDTPAPLFSAFPSSSVPRAPLGATHAPTRSSQ